MINIGLESTKEETEVAVTDKITTGPEIGLYSRDLYQNNYRGRGNYSRGGNRNYRSNYRDSSRS